MSRRNDDDRDAIFVKNGLPIKFCFHKSVTQGQDAITRDVECHGGQIVADERHANVLLVDEQEDIEFIRRRYYSSTELYRLTIYVEPRGFVRACIRVGIYRHVGPIQQGMPGRPPGAPRARVPFTEEDRDHLAYYLATRCPTRDGRLGKKAYQDLERLAQTDDESWLWARRHTWHSWREHYKMNPVIMDARIDVYLERLKNHGHHFGHDPRRRDFRNLRRLRQEEEESEEEVEVEERPERQEVRRQEGERQGQPQVRPACPPSLPLSRAPERQREQAAHEYLTLHEQALVRFDDEEDGGEEERDEDVTMWELRHIKRQRAPPEAPRLPETHIKRPRLSNTPSDDARTPDVENVREREGPGASKRKKTSVAEGSQEVEGNDLFGDRAYEAWDFSSDVYEHVEHPVPFSSRASPVPGQIGPPPSTQATLVASSPREKEVLPAPTRMRTKAKVPEGRAPVSTIQQVAPPNSQQMMVATQDPVIVQHARVRGASGEPGPSLPRPREKPKTRRGAAVPDVPYRNTRARSRSASLGPPPQTRQSRVSVKEEGQVQAVTAKGKGKGRDVLPLIEEDAHTEEGHAEERAKQDVIIQSNLVAGGLSTRETFEDEMAVVGLLEATPDTSEAFVIDLESRVDDEDDEVIPPYQDVGIDHPSDSDDAETHELLIRGAGAGAGGEDEGERRDDEGVGSDGREWDGESDGDSEKDDADRIKRMATGSLFAGLVPSLQPKVTRSMAMIQSQTHSQSQPQARTRIQMQMQTQAEHTSPRRTRSGQLRALPLAASGFGPGFPSPGTKARAVVNRSQEEERRAVYAPPEGTRAARAARGRARQTRG